MVAYTHTRTPFTVPITGASKTPVKGASRNAGTTTPASMAIRGQPKSLRVEEQCPAEGTLVDAKLNKILTQYRESPLLLGTIKNFLGQAEHVIRTICAIPSYFDLDHSIGDQLTILGKRMGWPRCHCVCDITPVFGFDCDPGTTDFVPLVGFCERGTWINCAEIGGSEICFDDDEVYRAFLKARRYQMLGLYDLASLQAALKIVWGETAWVPHAGEGRVVVSPGRDLTDRELRELPVVIRVLPIAPGIRATVFMGTGPIFGFGEGWFGLCENANWLCETDPHAYSCT